MRFTQESLIEAYTKLGWDVNNDDLHVEIGGVATSGIHQTEGANPKWAPPYGEVRYQNDAFIVIKNRSRNPFVPSKPNQEETK